MNLDAHLDRRPIIIAIAGPNGAGKSTFYEAFLSESALRCVNPDQIADELELDPYDAAQLAANVRHELVKRKESFIFETVFSDPVGEKVSFLKKAVDAGYTVGLCFIGLDASTTSDERVAMRVSQGGHDVPTGKLRTRFRRTLKNLERAIRELPLVLVYDNSDLNDPFRLAARIHEGRAVWISPEKPEWLRHLISRSQR